jgi:hypothetical protein
MEREEIRPRTAYMSPEVARQKLITYGFTGITSLRRVGEKYTARATSGTRTFDLELNAVTGVLREKGKTMPLVAPRQPRVPVIRGSQIKVARERIARPAATTPARQ